MDLRCDSGVLHGKTEPGFLEVSCKSRFCGKVGGVVVIHRFEVETGKLVGTFKFSNPTVTEVTNNVHCNESTTLRAS